MTYLLSLRPPRALIYHPEQVNILQGIFLVAFLAVFPVVFLVVSPPECHAFYDHPMPYTYLQDLSEKVFDEVKSIPESTVSRYYKPMSWLPHITLGKTLTKEQMQMAFSVMQESFVPFEAAITEIGLAMVNPHRDVVRWELKQQQ